MTKATLVRRSLCLINLAAAVYLLVKGFYLAAGFVAFVGCVPGTRR